MIGLSMLYRGRHAWEEDDLGVCGLGHGLHGFEVSDLHSWCAGQDVGGLAHQFCGLDLCGFTSLVDVLAVSSNTWYTHQHER